MKWIYSVMTAMLFACSTTPAFAGMEIDNAAGKQLGFAGKIKCGTGLSCSVSGIGVTINSPGTAGTPLISGVNTTYVPFPVATLTAGTSTTGLATSVYVTQVFIDNNASLTGIAVNNAATVGTNKYIVVLFNSSGVPLANSALAGVTTAGASSWQKIPFTAPVAVVGPAVYFVGVYINGATDTFYTIPAAGEYVGSAGSVTGQTFGTVSTITPPSTFTAGAGPIVHTY